MLKMMTTMMYSHWKLVAAVVKDTSVTFRQLFESGSHVQQATEVDLEAQGMFETGSGKTDSMILQLTEAGSLTLLWISD